MAWGSPKAPPPPQSALSKLLPMVVFFIIVGGLAFVGFHVYMIVNSIADTTNKKLEKRNVTFSKDGMKVGVKQVNNERYVDKTQSVLVKAWNYSSWPGYKSRLWNKPTEPEPKKSWSRSSSSASVRPDAASRTSSSSNVQSSASRHASTSSARTPTPSRHASTAA